MKKLKLSRSLKFTVLASALIMGMSSSVMAGKYTVKSGDTMFLIAESHGMTLKDMVSANPQVSDPNMIEVGQELNVAGAACKPSAAYNQAVADANAALDKAASVGGEWRDSRWKKSKFVKVKGKDGKSVKTSFMGAAAVAAENCDFDSAMKYLETAKFQGEMGYDQAMGQKDAGPKVN